MRQIELFVPGRICLFGEHSDWAGGYRRINSKINKGYAIICGTNQGLYARVTAAAGRLVFHSTSSIGEKKTFDIPLDTKKLLEVAAEGGYFSYIAGVAFQICTHYHVDGIEIDNYKTDLPLKKGLSSSAAVCVLVTRAFNRFYDLKMTTRGEMEIAYQGEVTTPSRCGRMDQGCAYGTRPILMTFDGDALHVDELHVTSPIHYVIVDLAAKKDTVKILADLNRSYPYPESELDKRVHEYLGPVNERVVHAAKNAIEEGKSDDLARCVSLAQEKFDGALIEACPEELAAPMLHKVINDAKKIPGVLGGKGVGSQGDGTAQFLVADEDAQHRLMRYLSEELALESLVCTIPATKRILKAVITAAGYGTRLFPLTMVYRKELMPVQDSRGDLLPLLLVHVFEALSAGIEEIAVVIQEEEESVFRKLFNEPMRPQVYAQLGQEKKKLALEIENAGSHITYIHQGKSRGLGGAVLAAKEWVGTQPFLLILGDHYFVPDSSADNTVLTCYRQLIDAYTGLDEMLFGVAQTPGAQVSRFGAVSGEWKDDSGLLSITELKEKPDLDYASQYLRISSLDKDTFYTFFGLYILPHSIFTILSQNEEAREDNHGELELTDAMEELRRQEGGFGLPIKGRKVDVGVPEEYLRAMREEGSSL